MPDTTEPTVTVTLTWSQARALAYASSIGIERGHWSDAKYRETAYDARIALLEAEARVQSQSRRKLGERAQENSKEEL
jgi:hypothetical protein